MLFMHPLATSTSRQDIKNLHELDYNISWSNITWFSFRKLKEMNFVPFARHDRDVAMQLHEAVHADAVRARVITGGSLRA